MKQKQLSQRRKNCQKSRMEEERKKVDEIDELKSQIRDMKDYPPDWCRRSVIEVYRILKDFECFSN